MSTFVKNKVMLGEVPKYTGTFYNGSAPALLRDSLLAGVLASLFAQRDSLAQPSKAQVTKDHRVGNLSGKPKRA